MAADDVCGPRYLELTVAALDKDPTVVLAHTLSQTINGKGEIVASEEMARGVIFDEGMPVRVHPHDRSRRFDDPLPHKRFREILLATFWCFEIFALIRREQMLLTYPKGLYYGSDKVMLAQLSLLGRFVEVPELQFFRRAHHGNSTNMTAVNDWEKWIGSQKKKRFELPTEFPCLLGYTSAVLTFPMSFSDRVKCAGSIARFMARPEKYKGLARQTWRRLRGEKAAAKRTSPVHTLC